MAEKEFTNNQITLDYSETIDEYGHGTWTGPIAKVTRVVNTGAKAKDIDTSTFDSINDTFDPGNIDWGTWQLEAVFDASAVNTWREIFRTQDKLYFRQKLGSVAVQKVTYGYINEFNLIQGGDRDSGLSKYALQIKASGAEIYGSIG